MGVKTRDEYEVERVLAKMVKPELPDYLKKAFGHATENLRLEYGVGRSGQKLIEGIGSVSGSGGIKASSTATTAAAISTNNNATNVIQRFDNEKSIESIASELPKVSLPHDNANDNANEGDEQSSFVPPNILVRRQAPQVPRPSWHAPWKLMRVISGHLGWVRAVAVDPSNEWFATGASDRLIKILDLASGTLKLSLTGHISSVRGLAVSDRHPYLFSCGEDKMVKCWDLEQNKVIRHYHGHLSGIYTMDLHPTLDLLVTAGRDSTARVWDMRTRQAVHVLTGHTNTIACVKAQAADPQIITSSMDSTVRAWDLVAGRTLATLTHHKKSVRALAIDPKE